MHVAALLIVEHSDQQWNGVDLRGAPKFVFDVPSLPARVVVPVVAVVWSEPGEDNDALVQIKCFTSELELVGGQGNKWSWPEIEGVLTKYHVFTHGVEIVADYEGLYYIGLAGEAIQDNSIYVPFQVRVRESFDAVVDPFIS